MTRKRWFSRRRFVSLSFPGDLWLQLHVGSPGVSGTENRALAARQPVVLDPDTGRSLLTVTWSDFPSDDTLTHISLWTAATGGLVLAAAELAEPLYPFRHAIVEFAPGRISFDAGLIV